MSKNIGREMKVIEETSDLIIMIEKNVWKWKKLFKWKLAMKLEEMS